MRFDDILDAIGNTPLVGMPGMSSKPGVRLWAKLEGNNPTGSTKDRIAKKIVERAEARGDLTPGVYFDGDKGMNGSIEVARALARDPKYYMPFQYGNPANPSAHEDGTAEEIVADLPQITHFVAGMGTGGTLTGVGRRLHRHDPNIRIVAAEPELGDLVYGLRSLDEGFVPPIFDPAQIDRKFLVNSADALRTNRELTAREGIFAGISGGAVVFVALRIAQEIDAGDIVCLLADGGWKYLSTEAWAEDIETAEKGVAESLWW